MDLKKTTSSEQEIILENKNKRTSNKIINLFNHEITELKRCY